MLSNVKPYNVKKLSKHIIFLISQPLDDRNYERFGIEYLMNNGWKVEIWDLTPLLYPKVWENFFQQGKKLKNTACYNQINSSKELFQRANNAEPGIFIDYIEICEYNYLKTKLILLNRRFLSLTLRMGAMPLPIPHNESRFDRIIRLVKKNVNKEENLASTFNRLFLKMYFQPSLSHYRKQFYRVVSGNVTYKEALNSIPEDQIIKAHNYDYDKYLLADTIDQFADEKYILFIDEDMAYHSDFIYQNVSSPVKPEVYFPTMRNALGYIADQLECSIKIATHPRSNYTGERSDAYGNIPIYHGITAELIKSAYLVIGHTSTSLQLAVLYKKPILFVTTNEIQNSGYQLFIDEYARVLHRNIVNLDTTLTGTDWSQYLQVSNKIYESYFFNYIKFANTDEKYSLEIIQSYFLNIFSDVFNITMKKNEIGKS
jgi:hypothetical protein